jgi:hypothetical protein
MAVILAASVGCVEPGQYGGPIAVEQTNVQGRLAVACGIRGPSSVCDALAEPDGETTDADAR